MTTSTQTKFDSLTDEDFIEIAQSLEPKEGKLPSKVLVYLSQPDIIICDPVHITGAIKSCELEFENGQSLVVLIGSE